MRWVNINVRTGPFGNPGVNETGDGMCLHKDLFQICTQTCVFINAYAKGMNINLKVWLIWVPYEERHNPCRKEGWWKFLNMSHIFFNSGSWREGNGHVAERSERN